MDCGDAVRVTVENTTATVISQPEINDDTDASTTAGRYDDDIRASGKCNTSYNGFIP